MCLLLNSTEKKNLKSQKSLIFQTVSKDHLDQNLFLNIDTLFFLILMLAAVWHPRFGYTSVKHQAASIINFVGQIFIRPEFVISAAGELMLFSVFLLRGRTHLFRPAADISFLPIISMPKHPFQSTRNKVKNNEVQNG